jgi:hypothetical protein
MRRFLPYLLCAVGALIAFMFFVVSLGTHSIEPTPQIRALERAQANRFIMCAATGFLLFVTGALWIIIRWFSRRSSHKSIT